MFSSNKYGVCTGRPSGNITFKYKSIGFVGVEVIIGMGIIFMLVHTAYSNVVNRMDEAEARNIRVKNNEIRGVESKISSIRELKRAELVAIDKEIDATRAASEAKIQSLNRTILQHQIRIEDITQKIAATKREADLTSRWSEELEAALQSFGAKSEGIVKRLLAERTSLGEKKAEAEDARSAAHRAALAAEHRLKVLLKKQKEHAGDLAELRRYHGVLERDIAMEKRKAQVVDSVFEF